VDKIMRLVQQDKITCIRSRSEGDFVLAHLSRGNHIDFVFGDDGDFLAFGVKRVIRNLNLHRSSGRAMLQSYSLEVILRTLKFTMPQFVDMCMLMHSDYTPVAIKNIGPVKSYNGILKHKTLERYAHSLRSKARHTYPDDFFETVRRARAIFTNPPCLECLDGVGLPPQPLGPAPLVPALNRTCHENKSGEVTTSPYFRQDTPQAEARKQASACAAQATQQSPVPCCKDKAEESSQAVLLACQ
jgi:hypothetical protein